jgi:orotidine-5'-phosphate decarboxylase
MNRLELINEIKKKKSLLCIGLDTDLGKIPKMLLSNSDPVAEFNRIIIEATQDLCISYKINTAFYESQGAKGWESLKKTLNYIPASILTIADAKRGDIGNTAEHYARTFFETFPFDAVTLSPYMGADTIMPYLRYKDKWAIILGLTSNPGAADFELSKLENGRMMFEKVIWQCSQLGSSDQIMFVAGATKPEYIEKIRQIVPENFLLVPGIGAQGGNLKDVCRAGLTNEAGLIINVSRSIIYASTEKDFAEVARREAKRLQVEMESLLK